MSQRRFRFSLGAVLLGVTLAIILYGYMKWLTAEEAATPVSPIPLHYQ